MGANPGLLNSCDLGVCCHEYDARALEVGDDSLQLASLFGADVVRHGVGRHLSEGDVIDLGSLSLQVLHTPGHTPGSICLFEPVEKALFSGDTVFAGSVGRTDFVGGSDMQLGMSLNRLVDFIGEMGVNTVYPGHGPVFPAEYVANVYRTYF